MSLENYASIIGDSKINDIYAKARKLQGTRILHINSTNQGGGVAEILRSLVPLMNDAGLDLNHLEEKAEEDVRIFGGIRLNPETVSPSLSDLKFCLQV